VGHEHVDRRAAQSPVVQRISRVTARRAPAVSDLLDLQSKAGNRTVAPLVAAAQRKTDVGPAGDAYEQEADAVSRQVMQSLQGGAHRAIQRESEMGEEEEEEPIQRRIQRESEMGEEEEEEPIQRRIQRRAAIGAEGGSLDDHTESLLQSQLGGGQPLPRGVRREMEGAFGADFSGVRVHGDGPASQLNAGMSATAFTVGRDIFFRSGQPDYGQPAGQELLAHELTHVVQQGGGSARRGSAS
jgi:hypothetical protein